MKIRTREHNFLAKIAGSPLADQNMIPRTEEEYWLNEIAKNKGGGDTPILPETSGSATAVDDIAVATLNMEPIEAGKQYIVTLDGTEYGPLTAVADGLHILLTESDDAFEIDSYQSEIDSTWVTVLKLPNPDNLPTVDYTVQIDEYTAPASGLPAVTADDDGDVLTVVDGAWTNAAPASGLPAYTAADIDKVLTVGEDAEHPTVQTVVPNQTVTLVEGGAVLANCNEAFFANAEIGDTISAKIDNVDVTMTAVDMNGSVVFTSGNHVIGKLGGNLIYGYTAENPPASVTVSATASVPDTVAKWDTINMVVDVEGGESNVTYEEVVKCMKSGGTVRFIFYDINGDYTHCGTALTYKVESSGLYPYTVRYILYYDTPADPSQHELRTDVLTANAENGTLFIR